MLRLSVQPQNYVLPPHTDLQLILKKPVLNYVSGKQARRKEEGREGREAIPQPPFLTSKFSGIIRITKCMCTYSDTKGII